MRSIKNNAPLLRALAVLSSVGVLVTGVTFAALQSQPAVLAGNTIQSATADLRIGTSASTFEASRSGFTFKDIVPGGPAMPADGFTMYLKNYGTATMDLRLAAGNSLVNASDIDLSKVHLTISRVDGSATQSITLQDLNDNGLALADGLTPGTAGIAQYKLRVSMDADAFSGQGASISGIDLVFSGTPAV